MIARAIDKARRGEPAWPKKPDTEGAALGERTITDAVIHYRMDGATTRWNHALRLVAYWEGRVVRNGESTAVKSAKSRGGCLMATIEHLGGP